MHKSCPFCGGWTWEMRHKLSCVMYKNRGNIIYRFNRVSELNDGKLKTSKNVPVKAMLTVISKENRWANKTVKGRMTCRRSKENSLHKTLKERRKLDSKRIHSHSTYVKWSKEPNFNCDPITTLWSCCFPSFVDCIHPIFTWNAPGMINWYQYCVLETGADGRNSVVETTRYKHTYHPVENAADTSVQASKGIIGKVRGRVYDFLEDCGCSQE